MSRVYRRHLLRSPGPGAIYNGFIWRWCLCCKQHKAMFRRGYVRRTFCR